ncbi:MAG TPA: hypothetical protein VG649_03410 [Candidatus Angelobacter sp.]|nr:hypothetical protein [Candidatus Angelobacter sp.]
MLRRDARRHFPLFVFYIFLSVPITAARLLTIANYTAYFYIFWLTNTALLVLGLVALHEVFHSVYEGFYQVLGFRLLYYGVIALVLIVTAINAVVNPPAHAHAVIGLILRMGIAINLLQAGIAAFYGALIKPLDIGFRRYPTGIVMGFGISAIGPFIGYFALSIFGTKFEVFTRNISGVAYILGVLIWLLAFAGPEREEEWSPPMPPEEMLKIVRGYLRALGRKEQ